MRNSSDTRESNPRLPACSAVLQTTAPSRAPIMIVSRRIFLRLKEVPGTSAGEN